MTVLVMLWAFAVAIPHILYVFSYHYGADLQRIIQHHQFAILSMVLRALTILLTILVLFHVQFKTWNFGTWLSPPVLVVLGGLIALFGLHLNSVIYQKLGNEGVYYACEMIGKCNRVDGYPYNIMSHPMYVACIMFILGAMLIIGFDKTYQKRIKVIMVLSWLIVLYIFSIYIESS